MDAVDNRRSFLLVVATALLIPLGAFAFSGSQTPTSADDWCCENFDCEGGPVQCIYSDGNLCFKAGVTECEGTKPPVQ